MVVRAFGGAVGYPMYPTRKAAPGVFSVNDCQQMIAEDRWPTVQDPLFAQVKFLFHANSVLNQGWPTDSSGTSIPTAFQSAKTTLNSPIFPQVSLDISGGYVLGNLGSLIVGTGDWTAECWIAASNTLSGTKVPLDFRPASTNGFYPTLLVSGQTVSYFANNTSQITSGNVISANVNTHIAAWRISGTTYLGAAGSVVGSKADSNSYPNITSVYVGNGSFTTTPFAGRVDEARLTIGTGRYGTGSTYTVPTSRFPDY